LAPGQQEGGNAWQRRDAKRKTARHERVSAAPAAPPQGNPGGGGGQQPGTGQPPYRDTQEREAPDVGVQALTYKSISKMQEYQNKLFEELRCEDYARGNKGSADPPAGLTLVVAPATAQEVGAPEEIAPEATGELGAGAHAPLAGSQPRNSVLLPPGEGGDAGDEGGGCARNAASRPFGDRLPSLLG